MSGRARTGGLKVRRRHGARSFWLTWRSGWRRHTVLLGGGRQGLTKRSAGIAATHLLAWPAAPNPELVAVIVRWGAAVGRRPVDG